MALLFGDGVGYARLPKCGEEAPATEHPEEAAPGGVGGEGCGETVEALVVHGKGPSLGCLPVAGTEMAGEPK